MMELTADLDTVEETKRWLAEVKGRLPLAQATALNRTAEDVLYREREQMVRAFTIREPRMLPPRFLPARWRATPQKLTAWANVGDRDESKIGNRRRQLLEPFETGRRKVGNPVAIPTTALRPTKTAVIPRKMYPKQLVGGLTSAGGMVGKFRTKKTKGGDILVSRHATGYFVLGRPGEARWGIYRNAGGRRLERLWILRDYVQRPPILRWFQTANLETEASWRRNFSNALDYALAARGR